MSSLQELQIRNAVGSGWLGGMLAGAFMTLMVAGVVAGWPRWLIGAAALGSAVMQVVVWDRVEGKAVRELVEE